MVSKLLEDGENIPIGYSFVRCHIIFDVKMEDFSSKARLVSGGQMIETPATMNYFRIISRENVCLDIIIATLNDLEVKCGDIINTYITAPIDKNIWTTLGPDFYLTLVNERWLSVSCTV